MGANKLLMPIKGRPMIERTVDAVLASPARPVILVTGNDAPEVEGAINAICEAARTGQIGDGKIFISSLEQIVRIRTGETGVEAI